METPTILKPTNSGTVLGFYAKYISITSEYARSWMQMILVILKLLLDRNKIGSTERLKTNFSSNKRTPCGVLFKLVPILDAIQASMKIRCAFECLFMCVWVCDSRSDAILKQPLGYCRRRRLFELTRGAHHSLVNRGAYSLNVGFPSYSKDAEWRASRVGFTVISLQ